MFNIALYKHFKSGDRFVYNTSRSQNIDRNAFIFSVTHNKVNSIQINGTSTWLHDMGESTRDNFLKVADDIKRIYIIKELYTDGL